MSEDPSGGFGGPDQDLFDRFGVACQGPSVIALDDDAIDGLRDRVIAARTWDALSDDDKALLQKGLDEVSAGQSPTLQDQYGPYSDWAAEDAASGDAGGGPES